MRLNNATIKQVIVSPVTLGERLRLCGIRPYNEYIDGNRTDTVLGYTYTVTCSGFQGERLDVKIPGKQLLDEDAYDICQLQHPAGHLPQPRERAARY